MAPLFFYHINILFFFKWLPYWCAWVQIFAIKNNVAENIFLCKPFFTQTSISIE